MRDVMWCDIETRTVFVSLFAWIKRLSVAKNRAIVFVFVFVFREVDYQFNNKMRAAVAMDVAHVLFGDVQRRQTEYFALAPVVRTCAYAIRLD